MAEKERPTARDLAGSAVDLNGYATFLQQLAQHKVDKDGNVKIPASRIIHMAEFMEKVVDELLALIPPDDVDDAPNR